MTTEVRRLFVLHCGYEVIPLAISLRGADPALWIAVPITAYLLDTARGAVKRTTHPLVWDLGLGKLLLLPAALVLFALGFYLPVERARLARALVRHA